MIEPAGPGLARRSPACCWRCCVSAMNAGRERCANAAVHRLRVPVCRWRHPALNKLRTRVDSMSGETITSAAAGSQDGRRRVTAGRAAGLSAIGDTPAVRLGRLADDRCAEVWVKMEAANPTGSYKDRMALAMIEGAEAAAAAAGWTVVEYTGGSTGSSLAFVCAVKGYPFGSCHPMRSPPRSSTRCARSAPRSSSYRARGASRRTCSRLGCAGVRDHG